MAEKAGTGPGRRGVVMTAVTLALMAVTAIVSVALAVSSSRAIYGYRDMRRSADSYLSAQLNAQALEQASDRLTNQVRLFTVTGDRAYLDSYFEEVDSAQREQALESLRAQLHGDEEPLYYLGESLRLSNELMQTEYRAMCLMLEASGGVDDSCPEALRAYPLSDADRALSAAEKERLARELVLNADYTAYKDAISLNVRKCSDALVQRTRTEQEASGDRLLGQLSGFRYLLAGLVALVIVIALMESFLLLRPIRRCITSVRNKTPMPVSGAEELRILERAYNDILESTERHREQLSFEATHDALTGLYNRRAYENAARSLDVGETALMIIDVDDFKGINDRYGHDVGDKVLKRVSREVLHVFRQNDYVCRIGGDEIAVLMVRVGPELQPLVNEKLLSIKKRLDHDEDGTPAITLSIGAAFGRPGMTMTDLFKLADRALYTVKENGRNGIHFRS